MPSKSLLPGDIVDTHVHIGDGTWNNIRTCAQQAGVCAIRDAGSRNGRGLQFTRRKKPAFISAGKALCGISGYGDRFGVRVKSRADIQRTIAENIENGARAIKVIASGIVSFKKIGSITPGGLFQKQLEYVLTIAQEAGIPVMVHGNGVEAIEYIIHASRSALPDDVTDRIPVSLEHGFYMKGEQLPRLAQEGITWVPTVSALEYAAHNENKKVKSYVQGIIANHLRMITQFVQKGGRIALGTDATVPCDDYAVRVQKEIEYLRKAFPDKLHLQQAVSENGTRLLGI